MIIGIDFDGICVSHEFPEIGKDIGAAPILRKLVKMGHKLILTTMRSDKGINENYLTYAINWFYDNEIKLWGIQTNPDQRSWTNSPKAYCNLYIDDSALGCPLKTDFSISARPFVDWDQVEQLLKTKNIL